ncbi:MAG TPA: glycosyltransferase, partial [Longimicrobiaceae bacterium]|nr:glycosyltransferase [Longimicrobiaceae bacterium]
MRVLHLYSGNLYGGVEAILAALARHAGLVPEMETRFALCFDGRLARELRAAGAAPAMLGAVRGSRPWTVLRARARLGRLLARSRPHAVVCHSAWAHALFAGRVRGAGLPLVFWQHDAVTGADFFERRAARTPPALAVCTSRFALGTLPRVFPHVRAEVVYPPVPPPSFASSPADRAAVRAELGTAAGEVVVVQVGRAEPWKGRRLHLEALGLLRGLPGWTTWMVGGAQRPYEERHLEEMRALAESLGIGGRVRFAGERADVPRLLAAADVLCQPNLGAEPFGIACVEGLYAGLPVVATALGGPAEVVDARCGALVPPDDPAALAAALRRLLEDPHARARLGA